MQLLLVPAGLVLGGLIGFATRPTHFGMQAPLSILFSNHPMDEPFRSEMIGHLGTYAGIGALVGAIVFGVVRAVTAGRKR